MAERLPIVTVETNTGGALLLESVRQRLEDLPVRVVPVTKTKPNRKARRG